MDDLIGKKIINVYSDSDRIYLKFETDNGNFYYECHGDCCASPYINSMQGLSDIIDQVVTEVLVEGADEIKNGSSDYTDVTFYTIKSLKGRLHIDFRVNHNGYYGGSLSKLDAPPTIHLYNKPNAEVTWIVMEDFE
jgi:hypothetical protein